MVMKIGNLAIVAATHSHCALNIYNGYATLYTGEGNERQSYICRIDDEARIADFIAHINFNKPITPSA